MSNPHRFVPVVHSQSIRSQMARRARRALLKPVLEVLEERRLLSGDAPVAVDDTFNFPEDTPLSASVITNDTDTENDTLTASKLTSPAHGALTFNPNGTFIYTPAADFNGTDSFTYQINDGTSDSAPATVNITIDPVADAPVVTNDVYSVDEDETLAVDVAHGVLFNDTDADGDTLSVALVTGPAHGELTLAPDGSFSYVPAANYHGPDSFTYTANDGSADSTVSTVSITVASVNDTPVAVDDAYVGTEDTALTVNATDGVLKNDTDIDGNTLTSLVVTSPQHGALVLNANGSFTYTPTVDFNGTDSFTYKVNDGTADGTTATVNLTISAVNDAPNVPVRNYSTDEDTQLVVTTDGGLISIASDVDGDPVTATLVNGPTHGAVTLNSDGSFTYTPAADYYGPDSFTYKLNDGLLDSAIGVAKITVNPVDDAGINEPPINIVPTAQTTNEDTTLVFSSANNNRVAVSDVDAGTSLMRVTLIAVGGQLTLAQGTGLTFTTGDGSGDTKMVFTGTIADIDAALDGMSFVPPTDYSGSAAISILTEDQGATGTGGARSDSDAVNITIAAVNDAPVNTAPASATTGEDTTLTFSAANGNAISTADNESTNLKVTLTGVHGTITLATISGIAFTVGDGTTDSTMTFTGAPAAINAALAGVKFIPDLDYNGSASFQIVTDDQNTGSALTDTDTVNITVSAVNDGPVNTVPVAPITGINVPLTFQTSSSSLIVVSDVDATSLKLTLTATHGTIKLAQVTGLTFTDGDGTDDLTMSFTGSLTDINNAINGLIFTPDTDFSGNATLQVASDDQGSDGSGGAKTDTDTITIKVQAENAAPVNNVPQGLQTTNEDTPLVFSTANGNAISISDADAGTDLLQVLISANHGTITLSRTTGLTFTTGDGNGDVVMNFSGKLTDINAALQGLTFTPEANYIADGAVITLVTDDKAHNGFGGAKSDTDTILVQPTAVNDAPVTTNPGNLIATLNTVFTLSGANGNALTINDVDAGTGILQVTLTSVRGTLKLSQITGLTFTAGDGDGDNTMTFTGTLTDINAALNGLKYTPDADFTGVGTLRVQVDDQGNTGVGGAKTDDDTYLITILPANIAPVNTLPEAQTIVEDTPLTFSSSGGNAISIADADAGGDTVRVTIGVGHGTLTLATLFGLTFNSGDGTADATMSFTGPLEAINAALSGLKYVPAANFNGTDSLSVSTDDLGHTGAGGNKIDTDNLTINISAVNDAPINTIPATRTTNKGAAISFSSASSTTVSVSDADAGTDPVKVTLTITHGKLTLSGTTGLTFISGDGTDDTAMSFTGTLTNINAALNGMIFTPDTGFSGSATIQLVSDDQGSSGTGGAKTDDDTITITVANRGPTAPNANYSTSEDTPLVVGTPGLLTGVTDADGDTFTAAAGAKAPSHGVITINPDGSFTYTPAANFNGTDTFQYKTTDGTTETTGSITITVTPVADNLSTQAFTASRFINATSTPIFPMSHVGNPDKKVIKLSIAGKPAHGSASVNNNGTPGNSADDYIVYTPNPGSLQADIITYKVTDSSGNFSSAAITIPAVKAGLTRRAGSNAIDLFVSGTDNADSIIVKKLSSGAIRVSLNKSILGNFTPTGKIVVDALKGNDRVTASGVTLPLAINGGGGNDTLIGGSGKDTLNGGDGDDLLTGGPGTDSFLKSAGHDRVLG